MGSWSIHENKEILSRYEILGHIGSGSYADVYKAKRRLDNALVALKEVHDYQSAHREIEALLRLRGHPHVIHLIEYLWLDEDDAVLVLEYLPSDLEAVIKEGQGQKPEGLTEPEIKTWMWQLLEGVLTCHSANVLHRDLKPSNLLISASGVLKVADFGQARIIDDHICNPALLGAHRVDESSQQFVDTHWEACDMVNSSIGGLRSVEQDERVSAIAIFHKKKVCASDSFSEGLSSPPSSPSPLLVEGNPTMCMEGISEHNVVLGSHMESEGLVDVWNCDLAGTDELTSKNAGSLDKCTSPGADSEGHFLGLAEEPEGGIPYLSSTQVGNAELPSWPDASRPECDPENEHCFNERASERSMEIFDCPGSYYREDLGSEYTGCVGTRWYRAPELLYGATSYATEVDMWAVGCMFGELLLGRPVFPGGSDIDQLSRIARTLGNPNEKNWPGISKLPNYGKITFTDQRVCISLQEFIKPGSQEAHDLVNKLINLDPASRLRADEALEHPFFSVEPVALPFCELKVPSPCEYRNITTSL